MQCRAQRVQFRTVDNTIVVGIKFDKNFQQALLYVLPVRICRMHCCSAVLVVECGVSHAMQQQIPWTRNGRQIGSIQYVGQRLSGNVDVSDFQFQVQHVGPFLFESFFDVEQLGVLRCDAGSEENVLCLQLTKFFKDRQVEAAQFAGLATVVHCSVEFGRQLLDFFRPIFEWVVEEVGGPWWWWRWLCFGCRLRRS